MKIEEALKLMREGKKITNKYLGEDTYLMGCYVGFPDHYDDNGKLITESFEEKKSRGMSIVKMKGDEQHKDMFPPLKFIEQMQFLERYPVLRERITYPIINLFLLMSDDWEVL